MRHPAPRITLLLLCLLTAGFVSADEPERFAVGSLPPAVDWLTAEGDTLGWDDLGGDRPLVMMFWATWCASCKKAWPRIAALAEELGDDGPVWASASLGEPADKVAREAAKRDLPGWVLVDPEETNGKRLGIRFVPTVCVLDTTGTVVYLGEPHLGKLRGILAPPEGE